MLGGKIFREISGIGNIQGIIRENCLGGKKSGAMFRSTCMITSLYMQRLWFVLPWLTHRYTVTHTQTDRQLLTGYTISSAIWANIKTGQKLSVCVCICVLTRVAQIITAACRDLWSCQARGQKNQYATQPNSRINPNHGHVWFELPGCSLVCCLTAIRAQRRRRSCVERSTTERNIRPVSVQIPQSSEDSPLPTLLPWLFCSINQSINEEIINLVKIAISHY